MSDNQKCFTGTLVAKRDVSVFADSPEEAAETIRLLYESGDACAEVGGATVTDVRQTDIQGSDYLDVYLFFDDETATMMDTPVLRVPPNTRELTDEMVREILIAKLGSTKYLKDHEKYIPLAAGWDRDKMADAMYALCCLILNNAALIEPKHAETISKVSDALGDCCGGDSSTYNACEAFGNVLKGLAVRVIPFPMPDLDEGEARDYEA